MPARLLLFLGFLLLNTPIWAEEPPTQLITPLGSPTYSLTHWGPAQGLLDTRVLAIARSSDGFLWLGTSGGLYRFDGVTFQSIAFSTSPARQHEVTALRIDREGTLWIGTIGDGLVSYRDQHFTVYNKSNGLPTDTIRSLDIDVDGQLWAATPSGLIKRAQGEFRVYDSKHGLARDFIASLCANTKAGLIASAGGKVHRLVGDHFVVVEDLVKPEDGRLDALFGASDGSIWITFEDSIVKRWDGASKIQIYTQKDGLSNRTSVIFEDSRHAIWAGCRQGLRHFNGRYFEDFREVDSEIGRGQVKSALCDQEGNLWVGFEAEGLIRIREGIATVLTEKQGLPESSIRCVTEAADGSLWIGTTSGMAHLHHGRCEAVTECEGRPIPTVTAICEAPDGRLWIGAGGRIMLRENGRLRWLKRWTNVFDIKSLVVAPNRALYVGTDGEGLWMLREQDAEAAFERVKLIPSRQIRTLYFDPQNRLWVGTAGDGAYFVEGNGATHLTVSNQDADNDRVYKFMPEDNGALWMATRNGLCLYENGRIRMLGHQDGVPEGLLYGMLDDGQGHIWISGNHGISRLPKAELLLRARGKGDAVKPWTLDADDGISPGPYGQGVLLHEVDGEAPHLAFGSLHGLTVIIPEKHEPSPEPPAALIDQVMLNGHAHTGLAPLIEAPGEGSVEIHYTSADLAEPERTIFSYKLEGLDPDWVDAGTRRYAHYSHVPPGTYRFLVRVGRKQEPWTEELTSLTFTLKPYLYQTAWMRVLACTCLAGLLCGAYSVRIRRLKARERELQRRIDETLASVKVLKGLVPVCASCKKIRDDQGYWNNVEHFLHQHADAQISHGICPECAMSLYPELGHDLILKLSKEDLERNPPRQPPPPAEPDEE